MMARPNWVTLSLTRKCPPQQYLWMWSMTMCWCYQWWSKPNWPLLPTFFDQKINYSICHIALKRYQTRRKLKFAIEIWLGQSTFIHPTISQLPTGPPFLNGIFHQTPLWQKSWYLQSKRLGRASKNQLPQVAVGELLYLAAIPIFWSGRPINGTHTLRQANASQRPIVVLHGPFNFVQQSITKIARSNCGQRLAFIPKNYLGKSAS